MHTPATRLQGTARTVNMAVQTGATSKYPKGYKAENGQVCVQKKKKCTGACRIFVHFFKFYYFFFFKERTMKRNVQALAWAPNEESTIFGDMST